MEVRTTENYISLYYPLTGGKNQVNWIHLFKEDKTRLVCMFCNSCLKYHAPDTCDVTETTVVDNKAVRNKDKPKCVYKIIFIPILRPIFSRMVKNFPRVINGFHCTELV